MTAEWHKSSYSSGNNECVEVREHAHGADMRDTQNRELSSLSFSPEEWRSFLHDVRTGQL